MIGALGTIGTLITLGTIVISNLQSYVSLTLSFECQAPAAVAPGP